MTDRTITQNAPSQRQSRGLFTRLADGLKHRLTSLPWLARGAGVGLSVVSIGFIVLFVLLLERSGDLVLITRPLPMQVVLGLPSLILVLTFATTVGAVLGWWNRYWSLRIRLHQTLLAVLGIGFTWQLHTLGFIGG